MIMCCRFGGPLPSVLGSPVNWPYMGTPGVVAGAAAGTAAGTHNDKFLLNLLFTPCKERQKNEPAKWMFTT